MIRQANLNDISGIMKIIQEAQKYFKENGIPQWQNGYPDEKQIQSDIEENGNNILIKMHIKGADFLKAKKTDKELIKTTTQKTKRAEEIKTVL